MMCPEIMYHEIRRGHALCDFLVLWHALASAMVVLPNLMGSRPHGCPNTPSGYGQCSRAPLIQPCSLSLGRIPLGHPLSVDQMRAGRRELEACMRMEGSEKRAYQEDPGRATSIVGLIVLHVGELSFSSQEADHCAMTSRHENRNEPLACRLLEARAVCERMAGLQSGLVQCRRWPEW